MNENCVLNIYKPEGMTSHQVVAIIRKLLKIKAVGHTGTLDPMATGVLPVCINRATKLVEYLDGDLKGYKCTMQLGKTSDTEDIWGNILSEKNFSNICEEDIRRAFKVMNGVVLQRPPMYSALKFKGKKLYEYARKGESVHVEKRKIYLQDCNIDDIDMDKGLITFSITCSKGTYMRSICRDIGDKLGCGAVMTSLERIFSGACKKEDAYELEYLKGLSERAIMELAIPAETILPNMGEIVLDEGSSYKFLNGMKISGRDILPLSPCVEVEHMKLLGFGSRNLYKVFGSVQRDTLREDDAIINSRRETDEEKIQFLGIGSISDENGSLKVEKMIYLR